MIINFQTHSVFMYAAHQVSLRAEWFSFTSDSDTLHT